MKLNSVEPLLEEIYKIEKIESISISDIRQTIGGTTYVIPLVMVSYKGNQSMALCSKDKYFDIFAKKVTEVYNDEKNNVYEDSLTDPFHLRTSIRIDEKSKKILESNELLSIREMYAHYDGLESYDNSLLFESDEVTTLIPIIQYHLSRFLEFTDTTFKVDPHITGYHTRYSMNGSLNGLEKFFPFIYRKESENHYHISISGILQNRPLNMKIDYESDEIKVKLYSDDYSLFAEYTYKVLNGVVRRKEDFTLRGLTTHYLNEDLESIDNPYPNISGFDYNKDFTYFKLPWNAVYGIKTGIEDITNEECKIEVISSVIELTDTSFVRRDAYKQDYKRKDTPSRVGEVITLEEYASILRGIELKNNPNYYVIETKFLEKGTSSGYFVTHLNGKYYYHLAYTEEDVDKATYQSDIPLTHSDINTKSDLENTSLVKQLVRRS